jgi:4-hydroxy 2-oxovalerate aldolase
LSFAYALAIVGAGGAARVLLTGFDGFDAQDPRQSEMVELFELYAQHADAPPVVALTRTSYPIDQSSIFAV